jgi:hypothetical protein
MDTNQSAIGRLKWRQDDLGLLNVAVELFFRFERTYLLEFIRGNATAGSNKYLIQYRSTYLHENDNCVALCRTLWQHPTQLGLILPR